MTAKSTFLLSLDEYLAMYTFTLYSLIPHCLNAGINFCVDFKKHIIIAFEIEKAISMNY